MFTNGFKLCVSLRIMNHTFWVSEFFIVFLGFGFACITAPCAFSLSDGHCVFQILLSLTIKNEFFPWFNGMLRNMILWKLFVYISLHRHAFSHFWLCFMCSRCQVCFNSGIYLHKCVCFNLHLELCFICVNVSMSLIIVKYVLRCLIFVKCFLFALAG